jgi:hypothetical protein
LRVQLLMRPLADGGWFQPGKGAVNVLGEAGVPVQASRDLQQEKALMQFVLDACPHLRMPKEGRNWRLQHPEQCLELLEQLRAVPAERLQLVWPEGERFRLRGSRSLQNLRLTIKSRASGLLLAASYRWMTGGCWRCVNCCKWQDQLADVSCN